MKISRATVFEDRSGITLELDVTDAGLTVRTKNGRTFVLATTEDVSALTDTLYDLQLRLERQQEQSLPGADETEPVPVHAKVEKANPTKPVSA